MLEKKISSLYFKFFRSVEYPSKKVDAEWHWNVKIWNETESRMKFLNVF